MLSGLSGNYKWNNQIDLKVNFDENKNQFSLFFSNGDEYKLVPIIGEELDFIDPNTDVQVSFTTNENTATFTLYGQTEIKL